MSGGCNERVVREFKTYEDSLKAWAHQLLYKFSLMDNPFEPMTKIVGDYSNCYRKRAAVNVLFKNHGPKVKTRSFWILRHPTKSCDELGVMIYKEEMRLKKMIWKMNSWGDPYEPKLYLQTVRSMSKDVYAEKYAKDIKRVLVSDHVTLDEKAKIIIDAIHQLGKKSYQYGWANRSVEYDSKFSDLKLETESLLRIYQDIELPLHRLKQIIDKY